MENKTNIPFTFILATTIFLAGLAKTARKIFSDTILDTYGEDSESAKSMETLPNEFFYFMVEYAFNSTEEDIKEGIFPANVFLDKDLLSKALTKNMMDFARGMTTNAAHDIASAFMQRVNMLDQMPWFAIAKPRLEEMWAHADEMMQQDSEVKE